jgi:hypothetical protein
MTDEERRVAMETEVIAGPRPAPDLSRYRADLADFALSADQERELLETLWNIMSSMVELGFSVDVCGLLFEEFNGASAPESGRVTLLSSPNLETPSDGSEEERLA